MQRTANQGCGKVAAAAAERRGDAGGGGADEAAHDRRQAILDERQRMLLEALFNHIFQGDRFTELLVRHDALPRVEMCALQAGRFEGRGDNDARKPLAKADDQIGGAWRQFANSADAAQQVVLCVEVMLQRAAQCEQSSALEQVACSFKMTRSQACAEGERP